jgi:hypothetical protein
VPVTYSLWWLLSKASVRELPANPGKFVQNAHVFHAANILLHIAAACVVFAILRRLLMTRFNADRTRWCALAGALVFALHPVQVEPVAWVSGFKDVLCGLLTAVALWQYIVYAQRVATTPANSRSAGERRAISRHYVFAVVAFILAMLSKPTATMFPLMALAVDALLLRRPIADTVRGILPLALFAIPGLIAAAVFQDARGVTTLVPIPWRPFVALDAITFYLMKLILPIHLALDYGRDPRMIINSGAWRYAFVAPCLLATIVIVSRKRFPALLTGAALFIAPLLPLLGFKPFDFQQYSTVADHYLYLPMIGVALIAAELLARVHGKIGTIVGSIVAAGLCVAWGTGANRQTRCWMDSRALWTHTIDVNPESWVSYLNLGEYFVTVDQPDLAEGLLRQSIALFDNEPARLNLGVIFLERNQLPQATRQFERAIAIRPTSEAHTNLGNAYGQAGRFDDAISEFEKALQIDPNDKKAKRMLIQTRGYLQTLQRRAATRPSGAQPPNPRN